MERILIGQGKFCHPNSINLSVGLIGPKAPYGERFWFLWWYCLSATNPFIHCGSAYQEWQANRAMVSQLYASGMDESEILSFAMFGSLLEVDEWN